MKKKKFHVEQPKNKMDRVKYFGVELYRYEMERIKKDLESQAAMMVEENLCLKKQ